MKGTYELKHLIEAGKKLEVMLSDLLYTVTKSQSN